MKPGELKQLIDSAKKEIKDYYTIRKAYMEIDDRLERLHVQLEAKASLKLDEEGPLVNWYKNKEGESFAYANDSVIVGSHSLPWNQVNGSVYVSFYLAKNELGNDIGFYVKDQTSARRGIENMYIRFLSKLDRL